MLTLTVSVDVLAVLVGATEAFTPAGAPETPSATVALNPLTGTTEIVLVPPAEGASDNDAGDADSEKSGVGGAGVTASVTGLECVSPPLVPVTVRV